MKDARVTRLPALLAWRAEHSREQGRLVLDGMQLGETKFTVAR